MLECNSRQNVVTDRILHTYYMFYKLATTYSTYNMMYMTHFFQRKRLFSNSWYITKTIHPSVYTLCNIHE